LQIEELKAGTKLEASAYDNLPTKEAGMQMMQEELPQTSQPAVGS